MMPIVVDVVVPPDHPALPGHFEGRPIVPAAWIVTLVDAAYREACGCGVSGVMHARFRAPLAPGTRVRIEIRRDGDRVAFRCSSEGATIADGALDA